MTNSEYSRTSCYCVTYGSNCNENPPSFFAGEQLEALDATELFLKILNPIKSCQSVFTQLIMVLTYNQHDCKGVQGTLDMKQ